MYVPENVFGAAERDLVVDVVSETQGNDLHVEFAEPERGSIFRQRVKIHRKEISRELTVDVVELVFSSFQLVELLVIA